MVSPVRGRTTPERKGRSTDEQGVPGRQWPRESSRAGRAAAARGVTVAPVLAGGRPLPVLCAGAGSATAAGCGLQALRALGRRLQHAHRPLQVQPRAPQDLVAR